MGAKRCTKCGGSGPFQKDTSKKDGLSCQCKGCKNSYSTTNKTRRAAKSKAWREANPEKFRAGTESWRKRDWKLVQTRNATSRVENRVSFQAYGRAFDHKRRTLINAHKTHPCLDCGQSHPPYGMDFDHVRGEKIAPVSQMLTKYSLDDILTEIQKCDLVCANCHRIRTESRKTPSLNPYRQALMVKLAALKSKPCKDCCRTYPTAAMEFDHLGDKVTDVSKIWSWERILVEVTKCELVCACCHRKRTHTRKQDKKAA